MTGRPRPETTALHEIVREHLATILAGHDEAQDRNPFPSFVRHEFQEYLTCGLLAAGFLRVHCPTCKQDALVAFSCKHRGFCPFCCARRMSDTVAHLVERVLPEASVRQWVFTLPHPLRFRLAYDPKLLRAVRRVFTRTVLAFYRRHLRTPQSPRTQSGAIVFVRFGSAVDLNVHLHALFLDSAYTAQDVVSPPRASPPANSIAVSNSAATSLDPRSPPNASPSSTTARFSTVSATPSATEPKPSSSTH